MRVPSIAFFRFRVFSLARSAVVLAGVLAQNGEVRLIFQARARCRKSQCVPRARRRTGRRSAGESSGKMHNLLFLATRLPSFTRADLLEYAECARLASSAFQQRLDNQHLRPLSRARPRPKQKGMASPSTPTFFVERSAAMVGPGGPNASLGAVIESLLAASKESTRQGESSPRDGAGDHLETTPRFEGQATAARKPCRNSATSSAPSAAVKPRQIAINCWRVPHAVRFRLQCTTHLPMHKGNRRWPMKLPLAPNEQGKFWRCTT